MQQSQGVPQRRQRRRTHTTVWILVSVLLLLMTSGVAILVWAGLLPGLSHVAGADKPRDLGVTTVPADYESVAQRLDAALETAAPAAGSPGAAAAPKQVDLELTESEVSALLGQGGPLGSPQVKLHAGGEIEVSAVMVTSDIPLDEVPSGVLRELIAGLPDVVPVYVRGTVYLAGPTELAMNVERLELGRLPLPAGIRDTMNEKLIGGVLNELLDPGSGLTVQELSFAEGKLHLRVTVPG